MMARPLTAFLAAIAVAATTTAPLSSAYAHDRGYQHQHAKKWKGSNAHKRHYTAGKRYGKKRYHAKKRYYGNKRYYGHRRYRGPVIVKRYGNDDALLFGVLGLAAGAIIAGSVLNGPANQPGYNTAPARDYYPPTPGGTSYSVGSGGIEPWTDEWYRYCANKYRSFNAATGTYRGYDGYDHFCQVR